MTANMTGSEADRMRRFVTVGALLAAGTVAALAAAAPATAASAPPNLSIALTDSAGHVHSNQDVIYSARIVNGGGRKFSGRLVMNVPGYVHVTGAPGGKVTRQGVQWSVSIPAGETVSRELRAHVGRIAAGELRVTALASVYRSKVTAVPLIRTADADRIDGVKDPAHTAPSGAASAKASTSGHRSDGTSWWLVAGVPAAALAILLAAGDYARRRRQVGHPAAGTEELAYAGAGAEGRSDF